MKTFKTFIQQQLDEFMGPIGAPGKEGKEWSDSVTKRRLELAQSRRKLKKKATTEEVEIEEGRKPTMAAAVNRAEKSRQRAIKRAGMQAKRMGGSDEAVKDAMRDHDVFSRDEKHVRSHLGETATTSDKEPVIIPAHRSATGKRIPAKTIMRAKHKAIVNKNDNPYDGE